MLPVKKHPSSVEKAIADFAKRLAVGETLTNVSSPPTLARAVVTATNVASLDTSIFAGAATINSIDVATPNGGKTVLANQGAKFDLSGGLDGITYWLRIEATTSNGGRKVDVELPVIVDRNV